MALFDNLRIGTNPRPDALESLSRYVTQRQASRASFGRGGVNVPDFLDLLARQTAEQGLGYLFPTNRRTGERGLSTRFAASLFTSLAGKSLASRAAQFRAAGEAGAAKINYLQERGPPANLAPGAGYVEPGMAEAGVTRSLANARTLDIASQLFEGQAGGGELAQAEGGLQQAILASQSANGIFGQAAASAAASGGAALRANLGAQLTPQLQRIAGERPGQSSFDPNRWRTRMGMGGARGYTGVANITGRRNLPSIMK